MKADPARWVIAAEDEADDFLLLCSAWERAGVSNPLVRVRNQNELLALLRRSAARPAFVLLDVKLTGRSGHEALRELKADPELRAIPVVMISTSADEADVKRAYAFGAASYFVKCASIAEMTELVRQLRCYWLEWAELPE